MFDSPDRCSSLIFQDCILKIEGFWILHFQQLQHQVNLKSSEYFQSSLCLPIYGSVLEWPVGGKFRPNKNHVDSRYNIDNQPPHPSSPFTRHNCQWIKSWKTPVLFYEYVTFICYQNTYFLPQMFQSSVIL